METDFWHQRWQRREIGFHEPAPNLLLTRHLAVLGLQPGARVLVPLCGKSRVMAWLLAKGYRVVGAELSQIAVTEVFAELGVVPDVAVIGPLTRHSAPQIEIFVGDIFDLTPEILGPVDAVHDRAALVALPPELRARYALHLVALTSTAPQLLNCFEYDQSLFQGPPFSVTDAELAQLYGGVYHRTEVDRMPVPGGLRGLPAQDVLWHLQKS